MSSKKKKYTHLCTYMCIYIKQIATQQMSHPHLSTPWVFSMSIVSYKKNNDDNDDDCWGANAEMTSTLIKSLENWNTRK